MKIGFASDFHLGKRLGHREIDGVNERILDFEAAVRHVIDGMIEARVDAAIIAGDLFDAATPPERCRQFLALEGQRLRTALPDALLAFMRGNHDAKMSWLDATAVGTVALGMPNVLVVDRHEAVVAVRGDTAITMIPWMKSDVDFLRAVEAAQPVEGKHNVLVLHAGMADLPEYAEMRPGEQLLTRSLVPVDRFDWIFSGHYHTHRTIADLHWTFIGSPERLSANEIGAPKGWLTYDTETRAIDFHVIPTRSWYGLEEINATGWDAPRIVAELRALRSTIPDWTEALVQAKISHLTPEVYGALDIAAVREFTAAAFYANIEFSVDDPLFADVGAESSEAPLLDDLGAEWGRQVAGLAGRTDEERARIARIGLTALEGGSLTMALIPNAVPAPSS